MYLKGEQPLGELFKLCLSHLFEYLIHLRIVFEEPVYILDRGTAPPAARWRHPRDPRTGPGTPGTPAPAGTPPGTRAGPAGGAASSGSPGKRLVARTPPPTGIPPMRSALPPELNEEGSLRRGGDRG